jgi:hypothetical protein
MRNINRDDVSLVDWRLASAPASGGTAITAATLVHVFIVDGTTMTQVQGRNYSTAVVVEFNTCPYMSFLMTTDSLATVTDGSANLQDGSTSTSFALSSLPTLANGGSLYVGSPRPFRGVKFDVDAVNGTTNATSVEYWNGSAWTGLSESDGTASGGKSFAQDGSMTWTMPATGAWVKDTLHDIWVAGSLPANPVGVVASKHHVAQYWTRWHANAAMDSETTVLTALALPGLAATNNGAQLVAGQVVDIYAPKDVGGIAGIEADCDAGSASLIVNCAAGAGGFTS